MCTIGCMYREQVHSGYDDTAMAVEQRRQKKKQQQYVPAPRPIQNRLLLVCQNSKRRRKEGGIGTAMRSARGPAHVHAGWQGRLHIGRTQSTQPSCWLPWHGRRRHLAGLRTWPIPIS